MRVALSCICLLAILAVAGGDSPWEITNGVVTLSFSPAISRISFFGRVDGPNALWMNPQKDSVVFADSPPWINHGGERFWPIPALAFAAAFESGWPPPDCIEKIQWKLLNRTPDTLEMESELIRQLGIVMKRRIHLPPGRPAAEFKSTIIRQERNHIPIQIWLTVQLPEPEYCIAAMAPDFPEWRKLSLLNRQWQGVSTRGNAVVFKPDQILPGAKIGFFAEKAVAVYPDCLFVQKTMLQPQFCYPECSNVQLYGNPVGNFGKYLEIEILGDYGNLKPGKSTELLSSWELLDRK